MASLQSVSLVFPQEQVGGCDELGVCLQSVRPHLDHSVGVVAEALGGRGGDSSSDLSSSVGLSLTSASR